MKTKEIKIQIPEGYEIDKENSTFDHVKFKSIKKNITYKDICEYLFKNKNSFYITNFGGIDNYLCVQTVMDKNNAPNRKQLTKVLALNQLLNIAKYYNRLHSTTNYPVTIGYNTVSNVYYIIGASTKFLQGIKAIFNSREDVKAVINNPNFREILDAIYK
jgi:hypothetical protein